MRIRSHLGVVAGAFLVLSIPACSSDANSDDPVVVPAVTVDTRPQDNGPGKVGPKLYDFRDEAAGVNCANGGQALLTGNDANANGVLDPSEITSARYICNGANGKAPMMAFRPEPIGTACPTGGQAISWGYDDNKSGALDPAEVKQTAYVCNGLNGANGLNGKTSLVTLIPQSPNQYCANGGQGIYTGIDLDGDGLLQPTEVKNTTFVCNGANGASGSNGQDGFSALVRRELEPAGANCTNGGLRFLSGLDTNRDGTLADAEVTNTGYACDGAPGAQGPTGPQGLAGTSAIATLLDVTAEPAGANCASGGQRIDVGGDINGNTSLDAGEITKTSYLCNGANGVPVGVPFLRKVTELHSGVICALGGKHVDAGADINANGSLDTWEVTETVDLCLRARHPATRSCASDAYAVDFGIDVDRNGSLEAGEVAVERCMPKFASFALGKEASSVHSCGVLVNGTVRCWGSRAYGAVGDGALSGYAFFPSAVPGLTGVAKLAAGLGTTCALLTDGTVRCWGATVDGATTPTLSPTPVQGLNGVASIGIGAAHACVAKTDGSVWCWGSNSDGQLGPAAPATSALAPIAAPVSAGIGSIVGIAAGGFATCGITTSGAVQCWGSNAFKQANPWAASGPAPYAIGNRVSAVEISVGSLTACARTVDGKAFCWGNGQTGETFAASDSVAATSASPVYVDNGMVKNSAGNWAATSVAAGYGDVCARSADGIARCLGNNVDGRVGVGQFSPVTQPTEIFAESP